MDILHEEDNEFFFKEITQSKIITNINIKG